MFRNLLLAAVLAYTVGALADQRDDWQIMDEAMQAWNREDYEEARKIMLPLARRGHAEALFRMGIIYERGLGVEPDMKIAEQFYNGYCPLPVE